MTRLLRVLPQTQESEGELEEWKLVSGEGRKEGTKLYLASNDGAVILAVWD